MKKVFYTEDTLKDILLRYKKSGGYTINCDVSTYNTTSYLLSKEVRDELDFNFTSFEDPITTNKNFDELPISKTIFKIDKKDAKFTPIELVYDFKEASKSNPPVDVRALDTKFKLDVVKELQFNNPNLIIGGSVGLYLHDVNIDRKEITDLDFIMPFYSPIISDQYKITDTEDHPSFNDFDEAIVIQNKDLSNDIIKVDVMIDPKVKYDEIEHNGFTYKVNKLENIWEAKIRYGLAGNKKHIRDLKNAMVKK